MNERKQQMLCLVHSRTPLRLISAYKQTQCSSARFLFLYPIIFFVEAELSFRTD